MARYFFNVKRWIPTEEQWILAGNAIQGEERQRVSEFVFKEDAKSALLGRILLRYTACKLTGLPWDEVWLKRTDKGKPVFDFKKSSNLLKDAFLHMSLNISHSGDYVVSVGEKTREIGVDIMDIRPTHGEIGKFFDLMKKNFTNNEWSCIYRQSDQNTKMKCFYRHWCLKESFVKAIGKGIGYSLQKLNFNVDSESDVLPGVLYSETRLQIDGINANDWVFEETMVDKNHCVAIATKNSDIQSCNDVEHLFTEVAFSDIEKCVQKVSSPNDDDFWANFSKKLMKTQ